MDIYSFINSRDVAAYCREIGKTWDTCEMMVIIGRSRNKMKARHKAWQELIDSYPDMPSPTNWRGEWGYNEIFEFNSVHEKLAEIMEYEHREKAKFHDWRTPYVDIPMPFKRGDIITYPGRADYICVLDHLDSDNPERLAELLRKYGASEYISEGWGYFVTDNGSLYGDHLFQNDSLEYYRGEFVDSNRLLHYLSLYFDDKIGITGLLNMQCRILFEHQLKCNFPINSHGCYISEQYLAENRLTEEELEQVKKGKALMPWVTGKLSIQQVEFLMKEFGGDYESVQLELVDGGRWYPGMCAGIVYDENHLEKTGDKMFNYERRSTARQILETYGWTEAGWVDKHANPENNEDNYPDPCMPDYTKLS